MSLAERFSKPYRVSHGKKFRLKDVDPSDTGAVESRRRAEEWLQNGVAGLRELQEKLYAQDRWALLLVFQALDAAGKDGTIKHVMSGINPQGCQVFSFKAPSNQELDHDFLWRTTCCLPERGRIGIFNRSYYEETLVVRVHPEILERQRLPKTAGHQADLRRAVRGHPQLRAVPDPQRHRDPEVLPPCLAEGAEEAAARAPGQAGQELEVLRRRRQGADALEGLPARLRGHDPRDRHAARAVVRRPGRPQVVHAPGRGRRHHRRARGHGSEVSVAEQSAAQGAPGGAQDPRLDLSQRAGNT